MVFIVLGVFAIAVGVVGVFTRRPFFKTTFVAAVVMFVVAYAMMMVALNNGLTWAVTILAGLGAMALVRRRSAPMVDAVATAVAAVAIAAPEVAVAKPKQVLRMVPTDVPPSKPQE